MNSNTYNGWSNYPTWAAHLWMTNDAGSDEYWTERTNECNSISDLADSIKNDFEEFAPELEGMYGDMMTWAIGMIDYYEIAEGFWTDRREEEEVEEEEVEE